MPIKVTQDINRKSFPISVILNNKSQVLTIKAAIELRQKLDSAISDYQVAEARVNPPIRGAEILKTGYHDAGAYARCSYCNRYSDKPAALYKDNYPCDCEKLHGWSGSFKKPTADAIWSEA